ncbi:unnamed protein product [Blepharisma stoltei]|uniref:Macro domain-containing protein n=1 Tax=Blepharisma stoltei TaxID=1481888 RepID=A0AAU9IKP0_9CILI|nr:unnamed protein product [Blepharisma stoltei]
MSENLSSVCARATLNNIVLEISQGSVLDLEVETIVNAANEQLQNFGGLAHQIVESGGDIIQNECDQAISTLGIIKTGQIVETGAGSLKFVKILHTVGPRVENKQENERHKQELVSAIYESIIYANNSQLRSIGIPAISCGIFGYPVDKAAIRHLEAFILYAGMFVTSNQHIYIKKIAFSLYTEGELSAFLTALWQKLEVFDTVEYIGSAKDRSYKANVGFCELCNQSIENKEAFMNITGLCCGKICNFCIFQHCQATCPCDQFRFPDDVIDSLYKYILCRKCCSYKPNSEMGCSCRQICTSCVYVMPVDFNGSRKCICGNKIKSELS